MPYEDYDFQFNKQPQNKCKHEILEVTFPTVYYLSIDRKKKTISKEVGDTSIISSDDFFCTECGKKFSQKYAKNLLDNYEWR